MDALEASGDGVRAGAVAEEAYRRFAGPTDPATAAVIRLRAAAFRAIEAPAAGLPLMKEALRLFEQTPPSAEHAKAWHDYAVIFLWSAEGQVQASLPALNRALEIAEAAGATALIPRVLASLANIVFLCGQVEEGLAILQRGWALARTSQDGAALFRLAAGESDALLKLAQFRNAADTALRGIESARQAGLEASWDVNLLAARASEALLALGRTAEAAALIDTLTAGPPDRDHWMVQQARAEIDLLRGDIAAAAARRQLIDAVVPRITGVDHACESAQRGAELALWAGRPGDALEEVRRALPLFTTPDLTILCGRLLAVGMRGCADLAERGRARRDDQAIQVALATANDLAAWVKREHNVPFTEHSFVASIPAERATWDAERGRATGVANPAAWQLAAEEWETLGYRHRAGYCRWRLAEAQLAAGGTPVSVAGAVRTAAAAADGHAPLLAEIRALARRARIPLDTKPAVVPEATSPHVSTSYGLTERELDVVRLLGEGRSNAEIGVELFISPRTAGVHVTNILRKLGVTNRVQAAAVAERAGLLGGGQTDGSVTHGGLG